MKEVNGIVLAPTGLTSRLSSSIVSEANKFKSNITICVMGEEADLKSIMNVMALVVPPGVEFTIKIEGVDEEKAFQCFSKTLPELSLANK